MVTKILVTGGAGNIGSALVSKLIQDSSHFVVVLDNLRTGTINKLPKGSPSNLSFIKADVNNYKDISSIMLSYKFDFVFHYAALVGVARTLQNPMDVMNDIDGIKFMLSLSKNTGVKRIFYSSSSEVYGEPVEFPQNELTTPLNSKLPYAIVKNVGEALCRTFHKEYGLQYTVFRFFNTYGPMQSLDFVVPRFIRNAVNGDDLSINGDGSQTRTFCYVEDNIDAVVKIFKEDHFLNDVVNIGNDNETSVLQLAKLIVNKTSSRSKIVHRPALVEGDMTRRKPDIAKMRSILGKELIALDEGIERILRINYGL